MTSALIMPKVMILCKFLLLNYKILSEVLRIYGYDTVIEFIWYLIAYHSKMKSDLPWYNSIG